ncbi:MAG TPA: alpha-L-fucosidase, partial [Caulobacteraceae bacterium]
MAHYPPDLASLNGRPLPSWYDDAKFGVFIHWGLFAIPGFAARLGNISDAFKTDYGRAVAMTPYTEWYANAIKVPGTPSAEFHKATYGDQPYEAFKAPFVAGLKDWDPASWAESFRDAGARYVVLVTKHHDGFCLWPSGVENPERAQWFTSRDVVGELATAVRAAGLRFGVYYSGGIDWTFNTEPVLTMADFMGSTPGGPYPDYADAQVRELIDRYEPSLLWNDISWPTPQERLNRLFADYYNAVPEGVVNDRWVAGDPDSSPLRDPAARRAMDERIKARMLRDPAAFDGIIPAVVPHSDFRTPEYARFPQIETKKWEATRGMSHSFGFNRNDTEADYAPFQTLLGDFIDGVAKNGNLLLNVGPQANGAISEAQAARLKAFG